VALTTLPEALPEVGNGGADPRFPKRFPRWATVAPTTLPEALPEVGNGAAAIGEVAIQDARAGQGSDTARAKARAVRMRARCRR